MQILDFPSKMPLHIQFEILQVHKIYISYNFFLGPPFFSNVAGQMTSMILPSTSFLR